MSTAITLAALVSLIWLSGWAVGQRPRRRVGVSQDTLGYIARLDRNGEFNGRRPLRAGRPTRVGGAPHPRRP